MASAAPPSSLLQYLQLYVVVGSFWGWNFIIALGRTVIAGSVGTWYWTKDKKVVPIAWHCEQRTWWCLFSFERKHAHRHP